MNIIKRSNLINIYLLSTGLLMSGTTSALECEVQLRAKKVTIETKWFGNVKKTQTLSETVKGNANTKKECIDQAIKKITDKGWQITYQKIIKP